jgi:hypothetical protein
MLYAIILLLVEKGIFEEEEGKLLMDKLRNSALPADYTSAQANVKRIVKEVEKELTFLEP